jgi:hypothetical protein
MATGPSVTLVPINAPLAAVSALADFTEPFGRDRAVIPVSITTPGAVGGDEPGWFAGSKGDKELTCDRSRLADILESQPDLARAWATSWGLATRGIRQFVMTLTPVVLRPDLEITIGGLTDGGFASIPAVLQAGTAILVTTRGEPAVRCFGSNPLGRATIITTGETPHDGTTWPSWDPSKDASVTAAATAITDFELVDIASGRRFARPVGVHGTQDSWLNP